MCTSLASLTLTQAVAGFSQQGECSRGLECKPGSCCAKVLSGTRAWLVSSILSHSLLFHLICLPNTPAFLLCWLPCTFLSTFRYTGYPVTFLSFYSAVRKMALHSQPLNSTSSPSRKSLFSDKKELTCSTLSSYILFSTQMPVILLNWKYDHITSLLQTFQYIPISSRIPKSSS